MEADGGWRAAAGRGWHTHILSSSKPIDVGRRPLSDVTTSPSRSLARSSPAASEATSRPMKMPCALSLSSSLNSPPESRRSTARTGSSDGGDWPTGGGGKVLGGVGSPQPPLTSCHALPLVAAAGAGATCASRACACASCACASAIISDCIPSSGRSCASLRCCSAARISMAAFECASDTVLPPVGAAGWGDTSEMLTGVDCRTGAEGGLEVWALTRAASEACVASREDRMSSAEDGGSMVARAQLRAPVRLLATPKSAVLGSLPLAVGLNGRRDADSFDERVLVVISSVRLGALPQSRKHLSLPLPRCYTQHLPQRQGPADGVSAARAIPLWNGRPLRHEGVFLGSLRAQIMGDTQPEEASSAPVPVLPSTQCEDDFDGGDTDDDDAESPEAPAKRIWGKLVTKHDSATTLLEMDAGPYTVGRAESSSLRLTESKVSGVHARLSHDNANAILEDLSTNGTFVNGHKVGKGRLRVLLHLDEIAVVAPTGVADASCHFVFFSPAAASSSSAAVAAAATAAASSSASAASSGESLEKELMCGICQDILYRPVALQPCMHSFCGACFAEWMKRKTECPGCRQAVRVVSRNHALANIVASYLVAHPDKKR